MPAYVCNGAKLKCSMGLALSDLGVVHVREQVYLHGKNISNIMDCRPMINIQPFGLCTSLSNPSVALATAAAMGILTPMPCIPNTSMPWMSGRKKVLIKGQPALMNDSKLTCMWGGTIEIIDNGQNL